MNTFTKTLACNTESTGVKWGRGEVFIRQRAFKGERALRVLEHLHNHRKKGPHSHGRASPSFTRGRSLHTHRKKEPHSYGRKSPSFTRGRFVHQGAFATKSPKKEPHSHGRKSHSFTRGRFIHQGAFHSPGGVSFTRGRFIHPTSALKHRSPLPAAQRSRIYPPLPTTHLGLLGVDHTVARIEPMNCSRLALYCVHLSMFYLMLIRFLSYKTALQHIRCLGSRLYLKG